MELDLVKTKQGTVDIMTAVVMEEGMEEPKGNVAMVDVVVETGRQRVELKYTEKEGI